MIRSMVILLSAALLIVLCATGRESHQDERLKVYLRGDCSKVPSGAAVESSVRESIRSSAGYVLVENPDEGNLLFALACINVGDGWTAIGYQYGLIVGARPEKLGTALWNPSFGVLSASADGAQRRGRELFARFDNDVNKH